MAEYKIKGLANQGGGYRIKGLASEQQDMQEPISQTEEPQNLMQKIMRYGLQDPVAGLAKGGRATLNLLPAGMRGLEGLAKMLREQQAKHPGVQELEGIDAQQTQNNRFFSQNGKPLSESIQELVDELAPPDFDYSAGVGIDNPSYLDKGIQKVAEYAPEVVGAIDLGAPLLFRHAAAAPLRKASKLAAERNIGPVNISPELIEDARQFLPNTAPYRNLIDKAMAGDYESLFSLQSDLGKHSRQLARNPFSAAERAHGRAGNAARQDLLGAKATELGKMGEQDIADLQRLGQQQYRRYQKLKPVVRGAGILALTQTGAPSYLRKLINKFGGD